MGDGGWFIAEKESLMEGPFRPELTRLDVIRSLAGLGPRERPEGGTRDDVG